MPARLAFLLTVFLPLAVPARAQEPSFVHVDPRELGLDLPPGAVEPGRGLAVLTLDGESQSVVGKLWVSVGDRCMVLLPSGELVVRHRDEVKSADRRFTAQTMEQTVQRLTNECPGLSVRKTRHYVYAFNTSENFAVAASRTLESMIPGMVNHAKQQKIDTHEPEFPLVAIMFRTRQQFDQYRRMHPSIVAYYDSLTNRVVMYEESPLYRVKPELAIQQSISTMAHEGAHQILHNIGVQQRLSLWPMWLSEGLAEYYAPTTFGKNLRWKGAGQINDMRMLELELYLKGRSATVPDGQMVEHTVCAARLTSTGYASAWSLTHFLAKTQRDKFNAWVRAISKLGPLEAMGETVPPGIVPRNLQTFRDHFGQDLSDMEDRLVKYLKSLPYTDPFAEWPHFVATVEVPRNRRPRREANLFHSAEMAEKWMAEVVASLPESQRPLARQSIEEFPNRIVAEQFARQYLGAGN